MDGVIAVQSNQKKSRIAMKKSFSDCALLPMKVWLQSQKELCTVSAEELGEQDRLSEITFLCFADATAMAPEELAATFAELLDLLKSLHLCSLNENEVIFLKDIHKSLETSDVLSQQNCPSQILCVMRLPPSVPRLSTDSVFTLLSKYTAGIRCTTETDSLQKYISDIPPTEDDDTNHSVSSIEDDFVTALEHLDEDEPSKITNPDQVTPEKPLQDAASQTIFAPHLDFTDPKRVIKPSAAVLVNLLELKALSPSVRSPVTASVSDPRMQMGFFRPHNSSDQSVNLSHKTLFSSSPAESSESECSSPSPVIFLDEEGYQRSLKAKLQLPKIPVMKDGIEDSDSEVSEFFDSFDQFDEQEQTIQSGCQLAKDPSAGHFSQQKMISCKKSSSAATAMNPQKFKLDRPTLPANVRKPTPRKPESSHSKNLLDVPDSPRPLKTSDDSGGLFSPVRSSAFSPLSSCFSPECLCHVGISRDTISQNHSLLYHTYSDFANTVSFEILGSVFNSPSSSLCRYTQELSNHNKIVPQGEGIPIAEIKRNRSEKELNKKRKSKQKALMIKDNIQKFASELVEKSFGNAFKDLQKSVSSCTNVLCHLAAKLTSSAFQMAFYEIGRQQALSLKQKAISGLAGFLVSEAITGALKELHSMKQQIFTNTVAKFAADLAEELVFEGIMEVCQFSHPSTPTASQNWSFHYDDKVVQSYAEDLSESVIQEAFIELSQVDVTFTTQAAISVSMNNIKYVSSESILESTPTSSAFTEFHDKVPVALNPIQEFRKEYTVHTALFYTSGIASSVPVPLAGSALCQNQILTDNVKTRNHSASDGQLKMCKESAQLNYPTRKRQDEVTSLRGIYLTSDNGPGSGCNTHLLYKQDDSKQANNSEISNISHLAQMPTISNFSGTMVDMIVTEAYEAVTSSKQYTDILKTEKTPYLQCIGQDTCRNMFGNYLAKRTAKESVDETKSPCSATSEKLAYCVGLGTNKENNKTELPGAVNRPDRKSSTPVIVGQRQMPLSSSSEFHVAPVRCRGRLPSGSKDCVQERKWPVACRFSTCASPPCSVAFVKHADEFPDAERYSAKPVSNPLEKYDLCKTAAVSVSGHENAFTLASVIPDCEDALRMEDGSKMRDGSLCLVPDTPPPTPLTPSQACSEWNLRKLTKKLKGELAKQFAPATPPPTPYRSEVDGVYENEHHYLEKEEFMLKLMRSLSEEVESSEDEYSETLAEKVKASVRTLAYSDHLATCIISMATEMAASHLDNETLQTKKNPLNVESKRCGSLACMNVPEKNVCTLWIYASDMAGKVISEAKKIVKSRHYKHLRLKHVNQADSLNLKRNCNECWSKGKKFLLADQWSKEADSSVLPLSQSSEAPGLISKFPSCESVTDEYADHIIQILKREGGHSELIMEQFASRLAYRSIKSGMQQAARKLRMKYNRKVAPAQNLQLNSMLDPFELVSKDTKKQKRNNIHHFGKRVSDSKYSISRTAYPKLLNFSESLACSITSDVRRKLKMSTVCLPKSLTDSCLYKKSQVSKVTVTDDLKTFSKSLSPFCCKQKLYHSTGSLNECAYREGIIHAIEQYARKIVDDTLEVSMESATLQTTGNWTNGERSTHAEKLSPFPAASCRYCCMKEHQYCTGSPSLHLPVQELHSKGGQISNSRLSGSSQKPHFLHLDIPKIHINMDEKVVFAENVISTTFDKAERQLSNTSLAADSGIGHDGISFAESLTTEIMTSCMTNIGQAANISSVGEEGFHSAESIVSQQISLSAGDDSTGSWSNLSFEDEQPDENSSFLHLSDSDGTEDKEEELKNTIPGLGCKEKSLVIINVDMQPCLVDSQLRMTLQWLSASEADVAELHFHDAVPKEFVLLSKRLRERGWKVGDLFQAVMKYCEVMEKATNGDRVPETPTLFGWLQDYI
ncbi:A-kinase anchor protein 11 isoform X2 [Eublepharis macularius]|uniref:A-kinase anchor protein 11 isoform X2 n=1 Tax=Eublepharis macularius TaxID=481883 RepID=A0AA97KUA0_EUBMA|nr:A-kinase anchor protein 11 isoform X2 [Eublepharis macularius]